MIEQKTKILSGYSFELKNVVSKDFKGRKVKDISFERAGFQENEIASHDGYISNGNDEVSDSTGFIKVDNEDPFLTTILSKYGKGSLLDKFPEKKFPGKLRIKIDLSYKSNGNEDGDELISNLAQTILVEEGANSKVLFEGGSNISGDQLTVKGALNMESPNGNLHKETALKMISKWLTEQIAEGKV